jgi:hypothetical protein
MTIIKGIVAITQTDCKTKKEPIKAPINKPI